MNVVPPMETAFRIIIGGAVVFVLFRFARSHTRDTKHSPAKLIAMCIGAAVFVGFVVAETLGTHREGGDGLYDAGDEVIDYQPTKSQRNNAGVVGFFVVAVPTVAGVLNGVQARRN